MRQIKLCLLGCLPVSLVLAVAGNSLGGSAPSRDDAGARAAFLEAYKVLMHPRCVNCHPAGDAPLQGEDSRPHTFFRLRRGADGHGVFTVKCVNCHQAQNLPGLHMPPGATYPLKDGAEDPAHRGEPRWHMPPAATPMVFEKRTPGQLCRQLLDKRQNGGMTPEQLVHHVNHDPFVVWGWNPGEGRSAPTLGHEEAVRELQSIAGYAQGNQPLKWKDVELQRKWLTFYGGAVRGRKRFDHEIVGVALAPEYSDADVESIWVASDFSEEPLLPAVLTENFSTVTVLKCPVILFNGRDDYNVSASLAAEWFERLKAPLKKLVWFERSAHDIVNEEPGKVLLSLVQVARPIAERAGDVASMSTLR